MPKTDLLAEPQVLLEEDQLRISAGLRDAGVLVRELMDVRVMCWKARQVRYRGVEEYDPVLASHCRL